MQPPHQLNLPQHLDFASQASMEVSEMQSYSDIVILYCKVK